MQRIFHTPEGVRDTFGQECVRKAGVTTRILEVFHSHGFEDIETPTFEYFEVFASEVGTISSQELYKFFDRDNHTLTLRPDFTPSIARATATYFSPDQEIVSLCYKGQAFTNNPGYQGRLKETTQMGVERMGEDSPQCDAELLAMTVECLLEAGLTDFQVSIGQVEYFKALLAQSGLPKEDWGQLRELISQKNFFGVEELVLERGMQGEAALAIAAVPQMFGGVEVLQKARELTRDPDALAAVGRLQEIYDLLEAYGLAKYISFDFGLLSKYQYYTGIIFQAYTYGTGEPLIKGGRYDRLLGHFGKEAPAIGFVILVDSLVRILGDGGEAGEEILDLPYTKEQSRWAIEEAKRLRSAGKRVRMHLVKKEGEQ